MKIIHTADIHLDSPLSQVKDSVKRRFELLKALANLSEYAENNDVSAIIVAGDLFDDKFTTAQTVESVADIIGKSSACWYVLQGNHGDSSPYLQLNARCRNLNLFGDDWTCYDIQNVTICGRELGGADKERYAELRLRTDRYNIVTLHGDVDDDSYGVIDGKALAKSGANYVALGHRHALQQFKFGTVRACYSGVLEPRGFDETADTGFILIDTDKDEIRFVSQAIRRVVTVTVDVSGIGGDIALQRAISDAVQGESPRNYLNVLFVGVLSSDVHLDMVARDSLNDKFFALRLEDKTTSPYDWNALAEEVSLRGEFVKLALKISDESTRSDVLKFGMNMLNGEE